MRKKSSKRRRAVLRLRDWTILKPPSSTASALRHPGAPTSSPSMISLPGIAQSPASRLAASSSLASA